MGKLDVERVGVRVVQVIEISKLADGDTGAPPVVDHIANYRLPMADGKEICAVLERAGFFRDKRTSKQFAEEVKELARAKAPFQRGSGSED